MKKVHRSRVKHVNGFILFITIFFALFTLFSATMAWRYNEESVTGGNNYNYYVTLTKYQTNTTTPLPGAIFELYKNDDTKIGGEYTTDQDGKISLDGTDIADLFDGGGFYFKEIKAPFGYLLNTTDNEHIYSFTLDDQNDIVNIIAYNQKQKQNINIAKVVTGDVVDPEQLFTFTITIGTDTTIEYPYSIDGVFVDNITSGGKIQLKAGQIATIEGIDVGKHYNIIEEQVAGYTLSHTTNSSGNMAEEGVNVTFTNKEGDNNDTSLIISKVIFGDTIDRDKEFEFIAIIGEDEYPFSLKHGESHVIDTITAGTKYVVEEVNYTADGYVTTSYRSVGTIEEGNNFSIFINEKKTIDSQEKGSLTITKSVIDDSIDPTEEFIFIVNIGTQVETIKLKHGESYTFTDLDINQSYLVRENDYFAEGYITRSIGASGTIQKNTIASFTNDKKTASLIGNSLTITKEVIGEIDDKTFEFVVVINDVNESIVVNESIILKHGESYTFENLNIDDYYEIYELDYSSDGYIAQIYNASGTITAGHKQVIATNFNKNRVMTDIIGEKKWEHGDNPVASHPTQVEVILKADGNIIDRKRIDEDNDNWQYTFNVPKYKADGVTEIVYSIDETPVLGYEKEIDGYNLLNRYSPIVSMQITVNKIISGDKPPVDSQFPFVMERITANAPMPADSLENKVEIQITGQGSGDFDHITYKEVGVYEYKIYEIKGNETGYRYDESEYILKVTVAQVGHELKTIKEIIKSGTAASDVTFTNQYESQTVKTYGDLVISKTVTGNQGNKNKAFDFRVIVGTEEYEFALKHGEEYKIADILVGTNYKVEEKNYSGEGYVTTSTGANGTIRKGLNEAKFTNSKTGTDPGTGPGTGPTKKYGSLTITKEVQGEVEEGKEFKFYVRVGELQYTIYLKGGESRTFDEISIGTSYNVEEHNYFDEGYETTSTNSNGTISGDMTTNFINRKTGELDKTGFDHKLLETITLISIILTILIITMILKRKELFSK